MRYTRNLNTKRNFHNSVRQRTSRLDLNHRIFKCKFDGQGNHDCNGELLYACQSDPAHRSLACVQGWRSLGNTKEEAERALDAAGARWQWLEEEVLEFQYTTPALLRWPSVASAEEEEEEEAAEGGVECLFCNAQIWGSTLFTDEIMPFEGAAAPAFFLTVLIVQLHKPKQLSLWYLTVGRSRGRHGPKLR